jgi:hypothetical protein
MYLVKLTTITTNGVAVDEWEAGEHEDALLMAHDLAMGTQAVHDKYPGLDAFSEVTIYANNLIRNKPTRQHRDRGPQHRRQKRIGTTMQIKGLTLDEFCQCVRDVSDSTYGGNLVLARDSEDQSNSRTNHCRARVAVTDSSGIGSRTSATGRHGPWTCWHAYRDVLLEVFRRYPSAVVRTRMATYKGAAGFEESFPATARINIGSDYQPASMTKLCECDDTEMSPDVRPQATEELLAFATQHVSYDPPPQPRTTAV